MNMWDMDLCTEKVNKTPLAEEEIKHRKEMYEKAKQLYESTLPNKGKPGWRRKILNDEEMEIIRKWWAGEFSTQE